MKLAVFDLVVFECAGRISYARQRVVALKKVWGGSPKRREFASSSADIRCWILATLSQRVMLGLDPSIFEAA